MAMTIPKTSRNVLQMLERPISPWERVQHDLPYTHARQSSNKQLRYETLSLKHWLAFQVATYSNFLTAL